MVIHKQFLNYSEKTAVIVRLNRWTIGMGLVLVAVVAVTVVIALSPPKTSAAAPVNCDGRSDTSAHQVTIKNSQLSTVKTEAKLCDTLTIINQDSRPRLVAFGVHDHHTAYDGVTEKTLDHGQNLTITLDQAGDFIFHDHLQDEVQGSFVVAAK